MNAMVNHILPLLREFKYKEAGGEKALCWIAGLGVSDLWFNIVILFDRYV